MTKVIFPPRRVELAMGDARDGDDRALKLNSHRKAGDTIA